MSALPPKADMRDSRAVFFEDTAARPTTASQPPGRDPRRRARAARAESPSRPDSRRIVSCGKKAVLSFAAIDLLLRAVRGRSDAQGQSQPIDGKGSKVRASG